MPSNAPTPLVHVIDDDTALLRAVTFLLESASWNVAPYASAEAFLAGWKDQAAPGCLLLDIRMPMMSGLELQRVLTEREIALPVIFMTGHGDVSMAVEAMKLGARDFIEKPFKDQTLLDAVAMAVRCSVARHEEDSVQRALCERLEKLSPRERQVARLLAEGLPNKTIGQRLEISERTVQVHRLHLMDKLEIHSAAELSQMMLRANPSNNS
ncbi:MAG: response regulator [Gammaproteobacteria bacterium]|nr:response regulator transcription factor [Rhodocyclaceae bacterium]MBU3910304.1 response regulator [Gammaproteobacteria bacterium]MBU4004131.1 response regulator [Gammaproteobacteria bacterium]MBU4020378.1 response regulator [Gammaproteobacteria bacterium]MBU4095454.1 response regulator [Gammaproteobacteria bacterium]